MMKSFSKLLVALLLGCPAWAQTVVTATPVKDSAGNPYVNGTYNIHLINNGATYATYIGGSYKVTPTVVVGNLDSFGNMTAVLADNSLITPAGTQWGFSVCAANAVTCFQTTLTISGGSQDVTASLQAAAASLSTLTAGTVPGSLYITGGNPWIDVRAYGAKGDGTTDDTTSIQNAINASTASTGCVFFPAGTYKITTALVGTSTTYCLIGAGTHQSKLTVAGASSTNSIFTTTSAPDGFKMKGLQIVGPGASASGGQIGVSIALSGGNVSDAIFEDLFFSGWPSYALDLEAPIVTTVRNVRVLQSKRGIFYNGGTSVTTVGCYMNQITLAGYDMKGTDYSSFISDAADTTGIAFLLRNLSVGVNIIGSGHEIGTARNVTVTNVALTGNVATVTYTGDDLSADFQSGMTVVVAGTSSTGGIFNGRVAPTSVTSSTIVYALVHADVVSASDSGTGSLFPGDGIVINNSTGTQVSGFYGLSAQQITSDHVVVSGTSNNTWLSGVIAEVGSSGTPVTQTIDVYMGASANNIMRFNNNLIGGTTNLSTNSQTYSNGSWTLGAAISQNGTPASAGFLRLTKGGILNFRNNANSADVNGLSLDANDTVIAGGTAGVRPGSVAFASLGTPNAGTMVYCSDCTIANPCASGGTGAIAKRLNGVWVCN